MANISNGIAKKPHEISTGDCISCHLDEKNEKNKIKSSIANSCLNCHSKLNIAFCHPIDKYPYQSTLIPDDMPLIEGKLSCLTCHYFHPKDEILKNTFVRKDAYGMIFCDSCHKNDQREHVDLGMAHIKPYKTESIGRIDEITALCVQCHYKQYNRRYSGLLICDSKLGHIVGVLYDGSRKGYRSASTLDKNINLFNGKIGCGTCHNIYSRIRNLLTLDTDRSRLCLECHVK